MAGEDVMQAFDQRIDKMNGGYVEITSSMKGLLEMITVPVWKGLYGDERRYRNNRVMAYTPNADAAKSINSCEKGVVIAFYIDYKGKECVYWDALE